jgi:two-component system heavy metal sensor histidine kinase CusS
MALPEATPPAPVQPARRRPVSLALRITALTCVSVALLLVLFSWGVEVSIERHFAMQDLGHMQAVAQALRAQLQPAMAPDAAQRLASTAAAHRGVDVEVQRDGRLLFATGDAALGAAAASVAAVPELSLQALHDWQAGGQPYRGAVLAAPPYRIVIAMPTAFHLHYLHALRRWLWTAALASMLLVSVVVVLAVRWGHAPLRRVSHTLHELGSERLHVRLDPLAVPRELSPLVGDFNAVLERLHGSFRRLSQFSADIAHELRTPITNLTTQLQVELGKPRTPERYRETLYASLEELERLTKTIGDMLFLAQAEHGQARPESAHVDLAQEVRELFEYFEALAEERHVRLALEGSAPPIVGDRLMWRRALSNLLSNALHYTAAGQQVTVRLGAAQQHATLSVENPGETIAPEHLPHLFDRFYRVDPSRQRHGEGAGLGLAIAKSIVEAHGGRIGVTSHEGVTVFSMQVPTPRGREARRVE